MKTQLTLLDIDNLKRELGHLLPTVKSSHRVEAMARGLGWNTHAALLAALKNGAAERAIDNQLFNQYLKEHEFIGTPFDALAEAVVRSKFASAREAMRAVMNREPVLARWGLGYAHDRKKSLEERRTEFEINRAELPSPQGIDEFLLACDFLAYYPMRRTINYRASSYGLKHRAEGFHRERGITGAYVGNGSLIAAALHLGFSYRADGINAYFNMGRQQSAPVARAITPGKYSPPPPQKPYQPTQRHQAWHNTMIATINAGLEQDVYGLEPGDNRWSGDHAIYCFRVGGIDAIAYVRDIGYDELIFQAAVAPTQDAERWIKCGNAGFSAGDAYVQGFLERRKGTWLQTGINPTCSFRRPILTHLASLTVSPNGYQPRGRVM